MPQPTAGDVHVNTPLTNISIAYMQNRNDFIATRVAPNIPVQRQSDRYYTYDKRYWMKTEAQKRAPGAPSAGSGFQVLSTPTYYADVFAVHKDVPDQIRANTDRPLDADRDATSWVTSQMLLKREKEFANTFIKTGVWATEVDLNASGQTKWDATGANPIDNVQEQSVDMMRKTGMRPNVGIMTPDVERVLANNSLVLDRIKYTQRGVVTRELLASLFGLDNLYVLSATEYTGEEPSSLYDPSSVSDAQSVNADMGFIAEDPDTDTGTGFFALAYVNPTPSILTPSAAYTFSWNGYLGSGEEGGRIKRFRVEENAADRIEMEMAFDMKVVCADLGMLFTNVHD
jgi:hypothetical protein